MIFSTFLGLASNVLTCSLRLDVELEIWIFPFEIIVILELNSKF